jgi:hypothetical protein
MCKISLCLFLSTTTIMRRMKVYNTSVELRRRRLCCVLLRDVRTDCQHSVGLLAIKHQLAIGKNTSVVIARKSRKCLDFTNCRRLFVQFRSLREYNVRLHRTLTDLLARCCVFSLFIKSYQFRQVHHQLY